jgi:hypothetical protein
LLASCSTQGSTSSSPSVSASPKVRLASDVPWITPNGSQRIYPPGIDEEEKFYSVLTAFQDIKCKRDTRGRGIYSVPESIWSITGYPIYLNRYYQEFYWGTSNEKLRVALASMAWAIAEMEDTVRYLESKSRSRDLRTWDSYLQKMAKAACQGPLLTDDEANKVLMDFLGNYEEFFFWRNEVFDQSREEDEAFAESLKPQCQEYPSSNPKYSIVKCTNLP